MSVYGMSRMVATSMGSTTTTAGLGMRMCRSLSRELYYRSCAASTLYPSPISELISIKYLFCYSIEHER